MTKPSTAVTIIPSAKARANQRNAGEAWLLSPSIPWRRWTLDSETIHSGGTVQTEQLPRAARAKEDQQRRKQAAEAQVQCPDPFHDKKTGGPNPPADKSVPLGQAPGLGEELGDSPGLDQFARLVEVIVHDRLGIDPERVINRGQ